MWRRFALQGPSGAHQSLMLAYIAMRLDHVLGQRRSLADFCGWLERPEPPDLRARHRARVQAALAEALAAGR